MPAQQGIKPHSYDHADKRNRFILAAQVSACAFLNGAGNFLHALVAGGCRHDLARRHCAVNQRQHAATGNNQINKVFKVHDNEIYIIKENSIKRANEIIKKSAFVKPSSQGIKINPKEEKNNKELAMSFKETRDLWSSVYNISNVNEYFNTKMEDKFK